jgi:hypothetical protein
VSGSCASPAGDGVVVEHSGRPRGGRRIGAPGSPATQPHHRTGGPQPAVRRRGEPTRRRACSASGTLRTTIPEVRHHRARAPACRHALSRDQHAVLLAVARYRTAALADMSTCATRAVRRDRLQLVPQPSLPEVPGPEPDTLDRVPEAALRADPCGHGSPVARPSGVFEQLAPTLASTNIAGARRTRLNPSGCSSCSRGGSRSSSSDSRRRS